MVSWVGQQAVGISNGVKHCSLVAIDASQRIVAKFDPTYDVLKLCLTASEVANEVFGSRVLKTCFPFIHAFRDITGFISARSIIGSLWGIASGDAGWEHPMGVRGSNLAQDKPRMNIYSMSKSIAFAVDDICSTVRWLATIGVLGEVVSKIGVGVKIFGSALAYSAIGVVGSVGCGVGSLFAIGEDVRQIVWGETQDGHIRVSRIKPSIGLDLINRVVTIAGLIFVSFSGVTLPVIGLGFFGIGSIVSLAKFLVEENEKKPFGVTSERK